jgi:putative ABC transport system permease protein
VLKGESATKIAGISFRKILFIFQFAVSLILIAGMLLVYQQLQFMKNYDLGFDRDHLIVLPIPTGFLFDKNSEEFISNEFQKHSGITSATTTSCIPGMNKNIIKGSFKLLGKTGDDNCSMNIMMVDPDFPNTYGVELIAGRSFENRQGIQSGNTCLINESARKVLGLTSAEEAVGKFLTDFDNHEIIGVLSDFHYCSLQHKIEPLFLTVNPDFYMYLTLKYNSRNSNEIVNFVKQQWAKLFPGDPFEYYFFDEIFEKQYLAENKFINVIFIFTVLAVFIACLGLYGLMLFTVERKTKEICIRKVFGSSISGIMTLLLKNYTGWILFSNILSIPLAYYLITNWLQNFAYRIEISWWIFILSGGIALVIALATVSFQAIKTATANPVEALRYE